MKPKWIVAEVNIFGGILKKLKKATKTNGCEFVANPIEEHLESKFWARQLCCRGPYLSAEGAFYQQNCAPQAHPAIASAEGAFYQQHSAPQAHPAIASAEGAKIQLLAQRGLSYRACWNTLQLAQRGSLAWCPKPRSGDGTHASCFKYNIK